MKTMRVVLADSDSLSRDWLTKALGRLGHEVCGTATTGRQLVERCRAACPDLIVAAIELPDLDGIEASRTISLERPTPALFLALSHDLDKIRRAAEDDALTYFVKPIKEADLKTAIPLLVRRFWQFQTMIREVADLHQALGDRDAIEAAKRVLMQRLGIDEDAAYRHLQKLASEQRKKLGEMARLLIGAEAANKPKR